jgi:Trp operon repressor
MWGEQKDQTKIPEIDNPREQLESLLKDNDKEILINAVRIRIISNRITTEKKDEVKAQLNSALTRFMQDGEDLLSGREMIKDWLKELK